MSASDIPETHSSPMAMARCLVSYLDCPDKIFRRIKAEFGTSPSHDTLQAMREAHLRPAYYVEPAKPHDGYYPSDASAELAATNALFLLRLDQERILSLAMRDYRKRVPALVE